METALAAREAVALERLTGEQMRYIANTDFVPKAYRGNVPAIMACVATGREYGLGDMQSLRMIDVIDGSPELNAEGAVLLARRAGHSIVILKEADDYITVQGRRADNGDTMQLTYTMADAQRAGLAGKSNWQKHPKEMLWARAAKTLCRRLFGDAVPNIPDHDEAIEIAEEQAEQEAIEAVARPMPPEDSTPSEQLSSGAEEPAGEAGGSAAEASPADESESLFQPPESVKKRTQPNPETGE